VIHLLCPSRKRPEAAAALEASFNATAVLPTTRLRFLVDNDDPLLNRYPADKIVGAPTGDPTGPLNTAALASEADIVGFIGDDSRCATKGWDAEVERVLREPGFAYGPDDTGPAVWPSTAFVTTAIIRAIGYFAYPELRRGFFDRQWMTVARGSRLERPLRSHFPHDNHEHPVDPKIIAADEAAFAKWQRESAVGDTRKALAVYDEIHFFPAHAIAV
jgi:hypothetical protein